MEAMLLLVHYCLNDLVNCQVDIVKLCGIVNWSMDLISSLPHQTAKMWDETLQLTVQLMQNPSMYMFMICKLRKILNLTYCVHRVTFCCHLNQSAEFYKMASETLAKAGYEHYEISSYSKSGYQCQRNVTYWNNRSFYAFGLGAASYLNGLGFSRPRKLGEYKTYVANLGDGLPNRS